MRYLVVAEKPPKPCRCCNACETRGSVHTLVVEVDGKRTIVGTPEARGLPRRAAAAMGTLPLGTVVKAYALRGGEPNELTSYEYGEFTVGLLPSGEGESG